MRSSSNGVPRRSSPRCAFVENGRRCRRIGFGDPPLCRTHGLVVAADLDADDFVAAIVDGVDRVIARHSNEVVRSFSTILSNLVGRARTRPRPRVHAPQPHVHAPRPSSAPPPKPPPPPPDPREILGFAPGAQLTASEVKRRQRELAAMFHPDRGGSVRAMQRVNDAAAALLAELGA